MFYVFELCDSGEKKGIRIEQSFQMFKLKYSYDLESINFFNPFIDETSREYADFQKKIFAFSGDILI